MFYSAFNFNQDINNWDTSSVTTMLFTFRGANKFNSPIGKWNLSNVENIQGLFDNAWVFNQDISFWDVSNVKNFGFLFARAYDFNQDISKWDMSNAGNNFFNPQIPNNTFLSHQSLYMFSEASKFNQDLSPWLLANRIPRFYLNSLDSINYTKMLLAVSNSTQRNINFISSNRSAPHVTLGTPYYDVASDAYNYLKNTLTWTFDPRTTSIRTPDLLFQYNESKTRIYTINKEIAIYSPVVISIYNTFTFSITPNLSTGLSMDTTTGFISGTPTVLSSPISYFIICSSYSSNVFMNSRMQTLVFSIVE